jgi:hypothetical protein
MTGAPVEPRLVFSLVVLTAPVAALAARWRFGSLSAMLEAWRDERPPLRDVAEDAAREVLTFGLRRRPVQLLGSGSVWRFFNWYLLALLVLYPIVHDGFPAVARTLQALAPW